MWLLNGLRPGPSDERELVAARTQAACRLLLELIPGGAPGQLTAEAASGLLNDLDVLLMHLRDGRCGDEQVLTTDALAHMHGDRIADAYGGDAYSPSTGYGMGWFIDRESGRIRDPGAYGSEAWLDLDDGYGAFLVIEADGSSIRQELLDLLYPIVDEAITSA